jgi:capsule polysaccharide export protein KpsE/RkpR
MRTPTVHLNGTSSRELREQLATAFLAVTEAQDKLVKAMPHGRDYYVQTGNATLEAQAEMRARIDKLEDVKNELMLMHQAVADQERSRSRP